MEDNNSITAILEIQEKQNGIKTNWKKSKLFIHLILFIISCVVFLIPCIILLYNISDINELFNTVGYNEDILDSSARTFSFLSFIALITIPISYSLFVVSQVIEMTIERYKPVLTAKYRQRLVIYNALIKYIIFNIFLFISLIGFSFFYRGKKMIWDLVQVEKNNPEGMQTLKIETLFKLILCIFIGSLFVTFEKMIMEFITLKYNQVAYATRIRDYNFASSIFNTLTNSQFSKVDPKLSIKEFTEKYMNNKELIKNKEILKMCKNIYETLYNGKELIVKNDLLPFFDHKEAENVFRFFDKDDNGDVSWEEMLDKINFIVQERKQIFLAMEDSTSAVRNLDKLLLTIVVGFWIISCFFIFSEDNNMDDLLALSSFFIGLGFIFGESAKQLFQSIIFIFVVHAYDSGDKIIIDDDFYLITKMELLGTTFERSDGQIIYISNYILSGMKIFNIRRSGDQTETIKFRIDFSTSPETIQEMKLRIWKYIKEEESRNFYLEPKFIVQDILDCVSLSISLSLIHKGNWMDYNKKSARRSRFMLALKNICTDLKITLNSLPQVVYKKDRPGSKKFDKR